MSYKEDRAKARIVAGILIIIVVVVTIIAIALG